MQPVRLTKDGQSLHASMVEAVSWQDTKASQPRPPRLGSVMQASTCTDDGVYGITLIPAGMAPSYPPTLL